MTREDELASLDRDDDGFYHPAAAELGEAGPFDCDDADAEIHPDATEICDGADQDCDGTADDGLDMAPWYPDADEDGYGVATAVVATCAAPSGFVGLSGDCDDKDSGRHPGAVELCDGQDDDCDGSTDESALDASTWYLDGDEDEHGTVVTSTVSCEAPTGYVGSSLDCDDAGFEVNPDATELCEDGVDNDCDGIDKTCGIAGASTLNDASASFVGEIAGDWAGVRLCHGDFDDDGHSDLVFGAPMAADGGAAYVVAGEPGLFLGRFELLAAASKLSGGAESGAGIGLASADFDSDGYDDLLVGAP